MSRTTSTRRQGAPAGRGSQSLVKPHAARGSSAPYGEYGITTMINGESKAVNIVQRLLDTCCPVAAPRVGDAGGVTDVTGTRGVIRRPHKKPLINKCDSIAESAIHVARQVVHSIIYAFLAWEGFSLSRKDYSRYENSFRKMFRALSGLSVDQIQDCVKFHNDKNLELVFESTDKTADRPEWLPEMYTGKCRRVISRCLARARASDISFLFTLQKGIKTQWPTLCASKVEAAVRKNFDALTRPVESLSQDVSSVIRDVSRRIFKKVPSSLDSFIPSGGATLESKRSNLGAMGMVDTLNVKTESFNHFPLQTAVKEITRWRQQEYNKCYEAASSELDWPTPEGGVVGCDMSMIALREPSKIRCISLSRGNVCNTLRPLQSSMLSAWKRTSMSTMLSQDLGQDIKTKIYNKAGVYFRTFCSGDYQAATDRLKKQATYDGLEGLKYHPLYQLAVKSFGPGWCEWKEFKLSGLVREGQPMGHTLSFPLLCVVNYSVYLKTLHDWIDTEEAIQLRVNLGHSRQEMYLNLVRAVLVNGDDILFMGSKLFFKLFDLNAKECGFSKSPGKNYHSDKLCIINSQIFRIDTLRHGQDPVRIGYLNLGVILGVPEFATKRGSRKQKETRNAKGVSVNTKENVDNPYYVSASLNKLLPYCPWMSRCLPDVFRRFNGKFRGANGYRPNWYLPVRLGGLGLDPRWCDKDVKITREQRITAAHAISQGDFTWLTKNQGKSKSLHPVFKRSGTEYLSPDALEKSKDVVSRKREGDSDVFASTISWLQKEMVPEDQSINYRYQKPIYWCSPMSKEQIDIESAKVAVYSQVLSLPKLSPIKIERLL